MCLEMAKSPSLEILYLFSSFLNNFYAKFMFYSVVRLSNFEFGSWPIQNDDRIVLNDLDETEENKNIVERICIRLRICKCTGHTPHSLIVFVNGTFF